MKHFSNLAIGLVADAKIEQAYQDGKFDRLPGLGQPFDLDENGHFPDWAKAKRRHEEIIPLQKKTNQK